MKLKPGVRILGLRAEIVIAMQIAESIAVRHGRELVVTSGIDGSHSRGSAHYKGDAFDMRIRFFTTPQAVRDDLAAALGADFDVVLETDHIHVEYDPKDPY